MKVGDIKELTPEERLNKIVDLKEELFNFRFQQEIGQLENPQKMKQLKRDIARVKTVIRHNELTNNDQEEQLPL
jgi:large subunit ribosomal protein L29